MEPQTVHKGLLVVISAPSGAGKSSILNEFISRRNDVVFSVSVTTRSPRPDEKDGVNYHFVTDEIFDTYIRKNAFTEWAEVHGKRYGTLAAAVREALEAGKIMVLDTDTVGAFNIKTRFPEAILIFILPPSPEILGQRLKNRKTESDEVIHKRLEAAPKEVACMKDYDYIIINDTISNAANALISILETEKLRPGRIIPTLTEWRDYINGTEGYGR